MFIMGIGFMSKPLQYIEQSRILKKGGILRLSVPDFDKLVAVYNSEKKDIRTIIGPLMGGKSMNLIIIRQSLLKNILKNCFYQLGSKR